MLTAASAGKVRAAWTGTARIQGPYPPVVLGGVAYSVGGTTSPVLTASSPRTGSVLWKLTLPYTLSAYGYGMTGSGSTVLVSFRTDPAGGVLAVDVAKHAVRWRATFPASTIDWIDRSYPGQPSTDGTRVYLSGSSNSVNAYSLTTGAFQWGIPLTHLSNDTIAGVDGFAVGGGYVYTGGAQGLLAYNAATGKKLWGTFPAISYGTPVLAAGRVIVSDGRAVEAFPAGGCGSATCRASWTTPVTSYDPSGPVIASADGSSVFLTYRTARPGGPTGCLDGFIGNVARLSASTGKVQWHVAVGSFTQGLIRGADAVWVLNEYRTSSCVDSYRILGYSTATTHTTPSASMVLPRRYFGFPQTLAVASGTLFETFQSTLIGYRVPGS